MAPHVDCCINCRGNEITETVITSPTAINNNPIFNEPSSICLNKKTLMKKLNLNEKNYYDRTYKKLLNTLSNEQLIHLIDKMQHSLFLIGETCVDVSKGHIDPDNAIRDIRNYIYHFPAMSNAENFIATINLDTGKITKEEYRKIILGE